MIYYFLSFLIFILGIGSFSRSKSSNQLFNIAVILIIIIAGLKTKGSTDYFSYKNIYENLNSIFSLSSSYELGFELFIKICKKLNFSFTIFYLMFTTVSISTKTFVFKKLTPYVFPALLIYICGLFFERDNDGIRQGMSIAFCFLSLYYLIQNKNKHFLGYFTVGVLFHYSSFLFISIFFFEKIKIKDRTISLIILAFFILSAYNLSFSNLLIKYIPSGNIFSKIEFYGSNIEYSSSMNISIGLLFRILIIGLFMKLRNKMKISERLYLILRNGFALSIVMSLAFNDFIILAHRLPYAFRELQIFIIPFLFTSIDRNLKLQLFYYFIVWIYCCLMLYRFLNGDNADVYNSYENYLFNL